MVLMLAVALPFLLDCVVGEMHQSVLKVLQRKGLAAGAQVAVLEPIAFDGMTPGHYYYETSQIALPALEEQGLLHVLLDDEGSHGTARSGR